MPGKHPPSHILYPIRHVAQKVHAELGGGLKCGVYLDALEERYRAIGQGMERNVLLPVTSGRVSAEYFAAGGIHADFTFKNRMVLVRAVSNPGSITEKMMLSHWFAMNDTGIPLGIILNFGLGEFEYRHVMHKAYEREFKVAQGWIRPEYGWTRADGSWARPGDSWTRGDDSRARADGGQGAMRDEPQAEPRRARRVVVVRRAGTGAAASRTA
jgi:hypothetical protein